MCADDSNILAWGHEFPQTWIWAQSNHFQIIKYQANDDAAPEGEIWTQVCVDFYVLPTHFL